jgi:opacity protein-like surface antigen
MARSWAVVAIVVAIAVIGSPRVLPAADQAAIAKGERQVVFSFDSWSLGSYNGGIGVRYFLRDDVAIRPGLDFVIDDSSEHQTSEEADRVMTDSVDVDGLSLGFSIFMEKYVSGFHGLTPFLAVGVSYTYGSSSGTQINNTYRDDLPDTYWSDCYDRSRHALGLIGAFGFQWFFTDHLSLGGQYNLTISHEWDDRDDTQTTYDGGETRVRTVRDDSDDTTVGVDAGRLLISVRF